MFMYETEDGTVLHPDVYSGNALYGKHAMELIDACDDLEVLHIIAHVGQIVDENLSVRRSNRMYLVGCLALLEIDIRLNDGVEKLSAKTHEKVITCAVKTFKKDLPLKKNMLRNLYHRAYNELAA